MPRTPSGSNDSVRVRSDKAIRVPKTAEIVAGRLRQQIIRGTLREGDLLRSEAELMEQFGVSRPTLRETIRILESESLIAVTRGSRGGARVLAPDIRVAARYAGLFLQHSGATLEDVQAARVLLEPQAARRLAEERAESAISVLRNHITLESAALADGPEFAQLSTRFHELIMELAGNQTLALIVGMLRDIIETHTARALTPEAIAATRTDLAVRSHKKLVDFIEAGEADKAMSHWREHVNSVAARMGAVMGERKKIDLFE